MLKRMFTLETLGNLFNFRKAKFTNTAKRMSIKASMVNPTHFVKIPSSIIIIKELNIPCKKIASPNPKIRYFVPCLGSKNDFAKKYPIKAEDRACKKVAPAKRKAVIKIASRMKNVSSESTNSRNNTAIFSIAAKPKAAIIIYSIRSMGSSSSGSLSTFAFTTEYFNISSIKATPIKIFKMIIPISGRGSCEVVSKKPISIKMVGKAINIPYRKIFKIILFDSGCASFLKKNKSQMMLGSIPRKK